MCIVFRHDSFPDQELHAVTRYAKVEKEGAEEHLFVIEDSLTGEKGGENKEDDEEMLQELPQVGANGDLREEVDRIRAEGFEVDDDNEPAIENIPVRPTPGMIQISGVEYDAWNSRTVCLRRKEGNRFEDPKLASHFKGKTRLSYFLGFLPTGYMQTVLLKESNKVVMEEAISWREFLRFIGLFLLMSTVSGSFDRRSYFSFTEVSEWEGAPFRLYKYMTGTRFNNIISYLRYTDANQPTFRDRFWEVRQLIQSWNNHMAQFFIAGWVSCLDESMSVWTNRWTCPGWMFVPRKPHPMGNEYHSICCSISGIMYQVELVEGKDRPKEIRKVEFEEKGKTSGLLLRLCKPLFGTGKVVILDSGFCVLTALIDLMKFGVYASALIKKRRYWPKYIDGESINRAMELKEIGESARLPGELSGIKFDVFAHKEPDYTMMLMSTYGCLNINDDQKASVRNVNGEVKEFKYTEVIGNHYRYRGSVDEHNSKRHDGGTGNGLSLEKTWHTSRWENRVFAFILGISEVNAYLAWKFFGGNTESLLEFRKQLAFELVFNEEGDDSNSDGDGGDSKRRKLRSQGRHDLITLAKGTGPKPNKVYKLNYQQFTCHTPSCHKRVRTVCSCSPTIIRCNACFVNHRVEVHHENK